ncbi:small ribosomal subunit Rsm22 family protein [Halorientalis pallida]|uniref:Class I SAM-dependent methyltransferase n=1 Tax=Halorientalis pallida TaxID=2479928 RepID=A0A498KVR7_9EURY|nr:class I SAM-dependent methyltransferase [Halorientalis pallida]RXK49339.1 class I SAM-dependent methyltransferase [Halorientalis pallida]
MNADQREQVRDNAQYLQSVRPIDPEEIQEYVEGQPHPATIMRVLREDAFDLGLLENDDGTFEPVEAGPLSVPFHGVEDFPSAYSMVLEELFVDEYGAGWPDGESGDAIRERIRDLKTDYLWGNDVEYDEETALAYALYHLPDYYAAVQYVLSDLIADGLLPRKLRVLDVGAGVGGPALGLADLVPEDALVEYHAVEPSAATAVLSALLDETGRNFRTTVHEATAEDFEPDGEYDLILFANVLSELDDPGGVVDRYRNALAADGSLVALAPADRETAIGLREVERAVEDGLSVYAPAVRLWPSATPSDEGWSFDVKPDLDTPAFQRRLDEAASDPDHEPGEFVNADVQYAYTIMRPDGQRRIDFSPSVSEFARMAEMDTHVSNRIDVAAIKLSHDLAGDDANPLFKIGDGSERVAHYAVLTKESALNRDLATAAYGDLLVCENVLALWNDDEEAYNLVVDGESVVDRVPAAA